MNILLFLFNTINGDFMKLNDIISKKLVVCNINDDLSVISSKMTEYDVGFIPIVEDNKIVGVITDRDIACRIFENSDVDPDITDYMSRDIVSVDVNSDISSVLDMMKIHKIKRILITDDRKVVGVCSISDLLVLDDYEDEIYDTIKSIYTIGPNKHKYETEIDEFYL